MSRPKRVVLMLALVTGACADREPAAPEMAVPLASVSVTGVAPRVVPSLETAIATLTDLITRDPNTPLGDKLEDALAKALGGRVEFAKTPPDCQAGLGNVEGVVGDVMAAVKDGLLPSADGARINGPLVAGARELASGTIESAAAEDADAGGLEEARRALTKGDARRDAGAHKDAVAYYRAAANEAAGAGGTCGPGDAFLVGSDGATITARGGRVVLRIPPAALANATVITVADGGVADPDEGTLPGTLSEFGPEGLEFAEPAELTIRYDAAVLPPDLGDPVASLLIVTREDGEWSESPAIVDPVAHTVTSLVLGFSVKALAEKTNDIDLEQESLTLAPSVTFTLLPSARSGRGHVLKNRAVQKLSLDPEVATVDQVGLVRAVAPGTTRLHFFPRLPRRFPPGFCPPFAGCLWPGLDFPVVVRMPVASVTVSPASATTMVGGSLRLTSELRDGEGNLLTDRDVAWTTSAEHVAGVDATGLVTGLEVGSAEVRATSEGASGSSRVDVAPAESGDLPQVPSGWRVSVFAATGLAQPGALAFDGAHNLIVVNAGPRPTTTGDCNGYVARITPDGSVTTLASGPWTSPSGLAFDPAGVLHVSETSAGPPCNSGGISIWRVGAAGGAAPFTGTASQRMVNAQGIGFTADGTLLVADNEITCPGCGGGGGGVLRVSPMGAVGVLVLGMVNPSPLAVDAAGFAFVSDLPLERVGRMVGSIERVTPDGVVNRFASGVTVTGLALDGQGRLVVADRAQRAILMLDDQNRDGIADPGEITTFATNVVASGIALDAEGNVYLSQAGRDRILLIRREGPALPANDTDRDGVPDPEDACPGEPGDGALTGCPSAQHALLGTGRGSCGCLPTRRHEIGLRSPARTSRGSSTAWSSARMARSKWEVPS